MGSCICGLLPNGGSKGPCLGEVKCHKKKNNNNNNKNKKIKEKEEEDLLGQRIHVLKPSS